MSRHGIGKLYSYEELKLSGNISDNVLQLSEKSAGVEPVTSSMLLFVDMSFAIVARH